MRLSLQLLDLLHVKGCDVPEGEQLFAEASLGARTVRSATVASSSSSTDLNWCVDWEIEVEQGHGDQLVWASHEPCEVRLRVCSHRMPFGACLAGLPASEKLIGEGKLKLVLGAASPGCPAAASSFGKARLLLNPQTAWGCDCREVSVVLRRGWECAGRLGVRCTIAGVTADWPLALTPPHSLPAQGLPGPAWGAEPPATGNPDGAQRAPLEERTGECAICFEAKAVLSELPCNCTLSYCMTCWDSALAASLRSCGYSRCPSCRSAVHAHFDPGIGRLQFSRSPEAQHRCDASRLAEETRPAQVLKLLEHGARETGDKPRQEGPRCSCGGQLQRLSIQRRLEELPGYDCVICSLCDGRVRSDTVWRCQSGENTMLHPLSYDVCEHCMDLYSSAELCLAI